MLQDLDQLAARIGLLVQRTRQLHAERDALRARLGDSERLQRSLQQRCAEHEDELQALRASMNEHGLSTEALREQLAREAAERQALQERLKMREAELQASLQARDSELNRLRTAALSARERIDAVLSRLPGASVGEQA